MEIWGVRELVTSKSLQYIFQPEAGAVEATGLRRGRSEGHMKGVTTMKNAPRPVMILSTAPGCRSGGSGSRVRTQ